MTIGASEAKNSFRLHCERGCRRVKHSAARRWFPAYDLPRREASTVAQLTAQGFQIFMALVAETVVRAQELSANSPLFLRDVVICRDLRRDRCRPMNGLHTVVGGDISNDMDAPLPRGVFKNALACLPLTGLAHVEPNMRRGRAVCVLTGRRASVLERLDADGRGRRLARNYGWQGGSPIRMVRGQVDLTPAPPRGAQRRIAG
jgi:hypothetical protein